MAKWHKALRHILKMQPEDITRACSSPLELSTKFWRTETPGPARPSAASVAKRPAPQAQQPCSQILQALTLSKQTPPKIRQALGPCLLLGVVVGSRREEHPGHIMQPLFAGSVSAPALRDVSFGAREVCPQPPPPTPAVKGKDAGSARRQGQGEGGSEVMPWKHTVRFEVTCGPQGKLQVLAEAVAPS